MIIARIVRNGDLPASKEQNWIFTVLGFMLFIIEIILKMLEKLLHIKRKQQCKKINKPL